jgi:uncharacterized membrane protein YphA (DoxX/SURF4 family)
MDNSPVPETPALHNAKLERTSALERFAVIYARMALGAAFLSAVADRFGLWGKYGGWGNFANFTKYTGEVLSFMPVSVIPFLAWAATIAELSLGILLILGLWTRWVAFGAATLLFLFGTSMAISFGLKSPLDYSVFSASAGAFLLALFTSRRSGANS